MAEQSNHFTTSQFSDVNVRPAGESHRGEWVEPNQKNYETNPKEKDDDKIYYKQHVTCLPQNQNEIKHVQIPIELPLSNAFPRLKVDDDEDTSSVVADSIPLLASPDSINNSVEEENAMKNYYEHFPAIAEVIDRERIDIVKAIALTSSIRQTIPSGDVHDSNTLLHILLGLVDDRIGECLFFDSNDGMNLHDATPYLSEIDSEDKPLVLVLNNSEGLGGDRYRETVMTEQELIKEMNSVIKNRSYHPVIEDIRERVARAHNVEKKSTKILRVSYGSLKIIYTVVQQGENIRQNGQKIEDNLRKEFPEYQSLKIHPLLQRPAFDIGYFDKRGNKNFVNKSEAYEVGPSGRTKRYIAPFGWFRHGLKVLGKYDNDHWIHPFQHPGNWYRAFHGTGNATRADFSDPSTSFDHEHAPVDAIASIYKNGFRTARKALYGPGVYCSPDPKMPEKGYVEAIPVLTADGKKNYKCMLQVAVNPDKVQPKTSDKWVVPNPEDIRPYGILIKEDTAETHD